MPRPWRCAASCTTAATAKSQIDIPKGLMMISSESRRRPSHSPDSSWPSVPSTATTSIWRSPARQATAAPKGRFGELSTVLALPEGEVGGPGELPLPGSRTAQLKAVGERRDAHRYELELEAPGGSEVRLPVRLNRNGVKVSGAELAGTTMRVKFPARDGYQRASVVFTL